MEQLLRDPNVQPTDEVIAVALGASFAAWRLLSEKLAEFKITIEWRYYNDGKAWLAKCVYGKKTVFWGSAWDGFFRVCLYFTEKTRTGIQDLPIDTKLKFDVANKSPMGKLIPVVFDVHSEEQLPDAIALIDYKRLLK